MDNMASGFQTSIKKSEKFNAKTNSAWIEQHGVRLNRTKKDIWFQHAASSDIGVFCVVSSVKTVCGDENTLSFIVTTRIDLKWREFMQEDKKTWCVVFAVSFTFNYTYFKWIKAQILNVAGDNNWLHFSAIFSINSTFTCIEFTLCACEYARTFRITSQFKYEISATHLRDFYFKMICIRLYATQCN